MTDRHRSWIVTAMTQRHTGYGNNSESGLQWMLQASVAAEVVVKCMVNSPREVVLYLILQL